MQPKSKPSIIKRLSTLRKTGSANNVHDPSNLSNHRRVISSPGLLRTVTPARQDADSMLEDCTAKVALHHSQLAAYLPVSCSRSHKAKKGAHAGMSSPSIGKFKKHDKAITDTVEDVEMLFCLLPQAVLVYESITTELGTLVTPTRIFHLFQNTQLVSASDRPSEKWVLQVVNNAVRPSGFYHLSSSQPASDKDTILLRFDSAENYTRWMLAMTDNVKDLSRQVILGSQRRRPSSVPELAEDRMNIRLEEMKEEPEFLEEKPVYEKTISTITPQIHQTERDDIEELIDLESWSFSNDQPDNVLDLSRLKTPRPEDFPQVPEVDSELLAAIQSDDLLSIEEQIDAALAAFGAAELAHTEVDTYHYGDEPRLDRTPSTISKVDSIDQQLDLYLVPSHNSSVPSLSSTDQQSPSSSAGTIVSLVSSHKNSNSFSSADSVVIRTSTSSKRESFFGGLIGYALHDKPPKQRKQLQSKRTPIESAKKSTRNRPRRSSSFASADIVRSSEDLTLTTAPVSPTLPSDMPSKVYKMLGARELEIRPLSCQKSRIKD